MKIILLLLAVLVSSLDVVWAEVKYADLWNERDELKVDWYGLSEEQKAFVLEKYRKEIDYCIANLGKKLSNLDMSKIGNDKGYARFNIVGNGLIALKFEDDYYNPRKAAEYYHKEWLNFKKCRLQSSSSPCNWPVNEDDPLDFAMGAWKEAGMYKELLAYYPVKYQIMLDNYSVGMDTAIIADAVQFKRLHPEEAEYYESFMKEWKDVKKLAKTAAPKLLQPAVQNHERFYRKKQEDVLKSLDYYYRNKVKFMVEKAAAHKNPVIADKAQEYLKNWDVRTADKK